MQKNKFLNTFNYKLFLILISIYILNISVFNYLPDFFLKHQNSPVSDIILSNIQHIDLSFLLVFGFFVPQAIILFYLILKKNFKTFFYFYFIIGMTSLIRLFFNMMTHLQVQSDVVTSKYFPNLFLDNDLFFSGHVAISFLFFLLYKKLNNKIIYISMLIWTTSMAATVLLMKVHYTIDVFSAPFIAFGIFTISDSILKNTFKINIKNEYAK